MLQIQMATCDNCGEEAQVGHAFSGQDDMSRCEHCKGYVYEGQEKTVIKAREKKDDDSI